jgi:CRISPR-associated protein Cas2
MPSLKTNYHIIAYDVSDQRRLRRIHRYLSNQAMPIQYSVFLMQGNAARVDEVEDHLRELMDETKDDIRIYTLPEKPQIITFGQQPLNDGIWLLTGQENDYLQKL